MKYVDVSVEPIPGVIIIDDTAYGEVGGQYFPVIGLVWDGKGGYFPMLDIPQMSDEHWQEQARERRAPREGAAV